MDMIEFVVSLTLIAVFGFVAGWQWFEHLQFGREHRALMKRLEEIEARIAPQK